MASPESPISQSFASGTNYWNNPANWAKPVQGNQFTTGTQALNSIGSINSENPAATAFSSSSQGPQGGGFNPQGAIPNQPANQATTSNTPGSQNSNIGNESAQLNASIQEQGDVTGQLNKANQASNQGNAGQASSGNGLSGFSNLVSSLGNQVGDYFGLSGSGSLTSQLGGAVNQAGLGLGFGTGSSTLGAVGGSEAQLLAGYGIAPGASSASSAAAADAAGGFSGYGASAGGGLTGASLTSVLGGAGIGAGIGSIYGMLTGKSGAQATNADIGGGVGGAVGTAILPGIGTILGSIGGSIIGGLFGPGPPTSASGEAGAFNAHGGINPDSIVTGGKNPNSETQQFVSSAVNQFGALSQAASTALGINFNTDYGFNAQTSTLHGGPWIAVQPMAGVASDGTGQIPINPGDSSSVASAYYQALTYAAQQSGYTDTQALHDWFYGQPTQGTNPTQFGAGITIAPKGATNNSGPIVA